MLSRQVVKLCRSEGPCNLDNSRYRGEQPRRCVQRGKAHMEYVLLGVLAAIVVAFSTHGGIRLGLLALVVALSILGSGSLLAMVAIFSWGILDRSEVLRARIFPFVMGACGFVFAAMALTSILSDTQTFWLLGASLASSIGVVICIRLTKTTATTDSNNTSPAMDSQAPRS